MIVLLPSKKAEIIDSVITTGEEWELTTPNPSNIIEAETVNE